MKFLVDAQLPRRLCYWLLERGHDAVHTLDLELGNRTPDLEIIRIADRDGRIVVTKDDDFVQSFLLGILLSDCCLSLLATFPMQSLSD